jgi:hypothetical protein
MVAIFKFLFVFKDDQGLVSFCLDRGKVHPLFCLSIGSSFNFVHASYLKEI